MRHLFRLHACLVVFWTATAICWIALRPPVVRADPNPKLAELERKVADLTLLYQQLGDRMSQAQAIRGALEDQQGQVVSEIQLLTKSLKIKSLEDAKATKQLRMHYDIELLRTTLAYSDELDAKIQTYQSGRERLGYLRQLAEDDIRMIATLSDLKIDALTTQISLVINRYLPEAHVIQIDPQQVTLLSARDVWDRVTQRR